MKYRFWKGTVTVIQTHPDGTVQMCCWPNTSFERIDSSYRYFYHPVNLKIFDSLEDLIAHESKTKYSSWLMELV